MNQIRSRELIDSELERLVQDAPLVDRLKQACLHMLFPGGKRIRPLLCLLFGQDLKAETTQLLPIACALEFLHTSSLIHDDLPAMDNDDFRRGKPSCHKAYGEASAILAGDLFVALAFQAIAGSDLTVSSRNSLSLILAQTYIQLCNGQELDMQPDTEASIGSSRTYELKTGALFGACLSFAAVAAEKDPGFVKQAEQLGIKLGVAFQILDDLIDADSVSKGRPTSSDFKNDKKTFVTAQRSLDHKEMLMNMQRSILTELADLTASTNSASSSMISLVFQGH